MAAMDLLGRRWALRILWELRHEPLGARALRSRCDQMSSSVLYERLGELTDAGLVARDETGAYLLTGLGASLGSALEPLNAWAGRWSDSQQQADHEEKRTNDDLEDDARKPPHSGAAHLVHRAQPGSCRPAAPSSR
jgi:DNA-binding HxlR family transcriptional regulator